MIFKYSLIFSVRVSSYIGRLLKVQGVSSEKCNRKCAQDLQDISIE